MKRSMEVQVQYSSLGRIPKRSGWDRLAANSARLGRGRFQITTLFCTTSTTSTKLYHHVLIDSYRNGRQSFAAWIRPSSTSAMGGLSQHSFVSSVQGGGQHPRSTWVFQS